MSFLKENIVLKEIKIIPKVIYEPIFLQHFSWFPNISFILIGQSIGIGLQNYD
jgi:hypothetical protein